MDTSVNDQPMTLRPTSRPRNSIRQPKKISISVNMPSRMKRSRYSQMA